jgi:predicted metal-binding membrane protein
MGVDHGVYCLGCCWVLMGLLFVVGVMNLAWVAAISAFVLLEKVAPGGVLIGRVASVGLIVAGLVVASAAVRGA